MQSLRRSPEMDKLKCEDSVKGLASWFQRDLDPTPEGCGIIIHQLESRKLSLLHEAGSNRLWNVRDISCRTEYKISTRHTVLAPPKPMFLLNHINVVICYGGCGRHISS